MKKLVVQVLLLVLVLGAITSSCRSTKVPIDISEKEKIAFNQTKADTITIANEETQYEIIIIEPGFNFWLQSIAQPKGFYSKKYLENRNALWVKEWNQRVLLPQRYNQNFYELSINYNSNSDYGYEVNYKLYNYFIYFQRKYNQHLGTFNPRI